MPASSRSYTAVSRAEWARPGWRAARALSAAKFRHPSVAPYLRALERVSGEIEALL